MQNWFCVDTPAVRLEPKREAEVPEIIIVSERESTREREWKRSKGVGRFELRKEVRVVKWFSLEYRKEAHVKIQRHL